MTRIRNAARQLSPRRSIRSRLSLIGTAILFAGLVIGALAFGQLFERQLVSNLDLSLGSLASDRANAIDAGLDPATQLETDQRETAVAVFDANGDLLANRGFVDPAQLDGIPVGSPSTLTLEVVEPKENEVESSELRVVAARPGDTTVVVASELEAVGRTVSEARALLAIGVPLLTLIGGGLFWFVIGRALSPVDRMRRDAQSIADLGDGQRVHDPESDDELGRLASTLNDMLERLDAGASSMRRFVSDASHEIRSPIANIRARVETSTADDWEPVASDVIGEVERIEVIIDDLTYLARSDEGRVRQSLVRVELDDLLFAEAVRVQRRGMVSADASDVEPVVVAGDRDQIARALRNIVDNAERHATTAIRLSVRSVDSNTARIEVDDDGPGIAADDRVRVFERFIRLDASRQRASGGTGLGLAIVSEIVALNRGTVSIEDAPLGGARLRIDLPISPGN